VTPNAEKLMPSDDRYDRMIEEARGRSEAEAKVSIEDLAAELGKSIRTLRRWNARPDAPQRIRRGRRLHVPAHRRAGLAREDIRGGGRSG
jgi:AraC-like DNA-binding protein